MVKSKKILKKSKSPYKKGLKTFLLKIERGLKMD